MASLPEFKRILREDLSEVAGEWVEKLIYPINNFNEQVYSSLNKNLTVGDNITGSIFKTSFTTPTDYIKNKNFTPINIPWNFRAAPKCVNVGYIAMAESNDIITNPISLDWRITGPNTITIRFIVGLKNITKYNITFLIL